MRREYKMDGLSGVLTKDVEYFTTSWKLNGELTYTQPDENEPDFQIRRTCGAGITLYGIDTKAAVEIGDSVNIYLYVEDLIIFDGSAIILGIHQYQSKATDDERYIIDLVSTQDFIGEFADWLAEQPEVDTGENGFEIFGDQGGLEDWG